MGPPPAGSLSANAYVAPHWSAAWAARLRTAAILLKLRVISLVLFTAVAASFAAADGLPPVHVLLALVGSGMLAAGGASVLNHYWDRDIDTLMERTRQRPLATGSIRDPRGVLLSGVAMVLSGSWWAATVNFALAFFVVAGAFVYVVVYTQWLKRRSPLNIVVGGLAGSAAVLGGWAAMSPQLGVVPWLLGGVVFAWTPAHFWSLALARSADYRQARIPMLPLVVGPAATSWWILGHIVAAVVLSLGTGLAAQWGPTYFVVALGIGASFLAMGIRLVGQPEGERAWEVFKFSGAFLGVLFLGVLGESLL